jgi:exonuclease VII small subunit
MSWVPVKEEDAPESTDAKERKITELMQHIQDLQREVNDLRRRV